MKHHTHSRSTGTTVSKRGSSWRLNGDDVVELLTQMPPLERLFCAVALLTWLAGWLGAT